MHLASVQVNHRHWPVDIFIAAIAIWCTQCALVDRLAVICAARAAIHIYEWLSAVYVLLNMFHHTGGSMCADESAQYTTSFAVPSRPDRRLSLNEAKAGRLEPITPISQNKRHITAARCRFPGVYLPSYVARIHHYYMSAANSSWTPHEPIGSS